MKELKIIPITPNTGGIVSTDEIVGRDKEIEKFWEKLEKQGLTLFAERRFGKSSILRKMEKQPQDGFIMLYFPIESVSTVNYLYKIIYEKIKERNLIEESKLTIIEKSYNKFTENVSKLGPIEFKEKQDYWQQEIKSLFENLTKQNEGKKIVIILDEFSIFLDKLPEKEAAILIGFLRDITYIGKFKNIRFVYCGSIGIDLVLDKIKKTENIGDPLNHMYKYNLQPFTDENALYFGKCLELGCEIEITEKNIKYICKKSNNIPYFIDVVFDKIRNIDKISRTVINNAFDEILNDTSSKESIRHFYDRIKLFYPKAKISENILNFVSKNDKMSSEIEIYNHVFAFIQEIDRIDVNNEIERLRNDGYLIRKLKERERYFDFKYSILKKWWDINKAF
ncbi:MAG: hypothetical protein K8R54_08650 [Bacteroidales bacterium]|nr:hypothetical protein [Bacteroidales bacterium]